MGSPSLRTVSSSWRLCCNPPSPTTVTTRLPLATAAPMLAGKPKPMEPSPGELNTRWPAFTRKACRTISAQLPLLPGTSTSSAHQLLAQRLDQSVGVDRGILARRCRGNDGIAVLPLDAAVEPALGVLPGTRARPELPQEIARVGRRSHVEGEAELGDLVRVDVDHDLPRPWRERRIVEPDLHQVHPGADGDEKVGVLLREVRPPLTDGAWPPHVERVVLGQQVRAPSTWSGRVSRRPRPSVERTAPRLPGGCRCRQARSDVARPREGQPSVSPTRRRMPALPPPLRRPRCPRALGPRPTPPGHQAGCRARQGRDDRRDTGAAPRQGGA